MTLIDLKKTATLKWAVAVLATLLIAVMLGCSGEPEVRIVEVEKIVEREVVVVVTATPASTPVPIPPTVAPTPTAELVIRHSLSAGSKHTCGLRQDGKAVCWGVDPAGESSLLENERFTSIDVGSGQICGIRENGTVACWGDNHKGEASPPGGKFVAVSAGFNKTCGLLANGEATCWGGIYRGNDPINGRFISISVPVTGRSVGRQEIGTWYPYACGLRSNGQAVCFGHEDFALRDRPEPPGGRFVSITTGERFACALREDGTGACWGMDIGGPDRRPVPVTHRFVAIDAGREHVCGLEEDGGVVCWGEASYGQASPQHDLHLAVASTASIAVGPGQGEFSDVSFDAASVLARFSTPDPIEGEERATAVGEIITQYESGSADRARVLNLLHTVAPELSISERRNAADELSRISADDQWDENETAEGVFYLAAFITGDEPNPGERIEAAHEMVALYETGDLDADNALGLMDTIAPSLGVNERRQAAAALARLSADDDWDDADRMEAASEVFRLVTGVPLNAEERMGAAVDLTGVGVKVFDTDGSFNDRDIDNATEIIKQSLTGELTSESLERILGFGN